MNNKYFDEYIKAKNKYLRYKSIMSGGYFDMKQPFDFTIIKTLDKCLTKESIYLINSLQSIMEPYNKQLDYIIKPFNEDITKLVNLMNHKIEKVKYKEIHKNNTIVPHVIKNIDINEFRDVESKGNIEINNYLEKQINNFKKINNKNNEEVFLPVGFIGSGVIEDLKKDPNKLSKYTEYQINNIKVTIFNRVDKDNSELIKNVDLYMKIINKVANHFNLKFIYPNIILLLSDAKKTFELENNIFTINNVNSAEYNPLTNQLSIYRQEEFLKLLLHELSHRALLEQNIDNYITKEWENKWNIDRNGSLLVRETLVETFAQFMNICITSYICNNNKFNETFNILWKSELLFGLYQTAKILYLSGFRSNKEFTNKQSNNKIKAMTSVVEYHIFKTILMLNFNEFYLYYRSNMEKILELIYTFSVNNEIYNNIIDGIINDLDKVNKESRLYKTGRMSIVERNILD